MKGELISMWGGQIIHADHLDRTMPRLTHSVVQVDEQLFLLTVSDQEPADCFNHSCDPNLGIHGQIALVAMRAIEAGEELTFDYAMTDGSAYDEFTCECGAPNCRRAVRGDDWKIPLLWEKYDGYFSDYLARRIAALK